MSSSTIGNIVFLIGIAIPAVIGLTILIPGLSTWSRARSGQSWPTVQGTIIESSVEAHSYRSRSTGSRRFRTSYYPRVVYTYRVAGQDYTSERIYFGARVGDSDHQAAEKHIARYPQNSPVTLYYDPQNPAEAALELRSSWMPFIAGLLLLTISVILLILFLTQS